MDEKRKLVWASAHKMTQEQMKDLESQGELLFLMDLDMNLYSKMCNILPSDDLNIIAISLLDTVAALPKPDSELNIIVQPAGSPAFQFKLGNNVELFKKPVQVWYAQSERASEDIPQPDGSVKKVSVFKHLGWEKL